MCIAFDVAVVGYSELPERSLLSLVARFDEEFTADRISNFSSYIRENEGQLFSENDIEFLLRILTPSVTEKATKLLRFIAKEHPYAGEQFTIQWWGMEGQIKLVNEHKGPSFSDDPTMFAACEHLFPYFAASWSRNAGEFLFLLNSHLRAAQHFLEQGEDEKFLRITSAGWSYLQSIEMPGNESTNAFVAMWFDAATDRLWTQAIRPSVYDAGYKPVRVDAIEHSNKIDDEIIAQIRACKFVVADFTNQRQGVYFEAGFAIGLGKRVIWCVKDADLKDVHFDNRQYNFIRWKEDNFPGFKRALTNRIEALFGKGSVKLDKQD